MPFIFRWLHLSDIHFSAAAHAEDFRQVFLYGNPENAAGGEIDNVESGGLRWQIQQTPVDCIVLTGDLFHQGKWAKTERDRISSFIKEIYMICNDASTENDPWNWEDGSPMDRLFFCPGNHDLKRNAVHEDDDLLSSRADILTSTVDVSIHITNGYFTPGDNRALLTSDTFGPFYKAMERLTGIHNNDEYRYEAQLFQLSRQPPNGFLPICFVGFNTALLAGQTYEKPELEQEIQAAYQEFDKAHHQQNTQQALEAYKKYHSLISKKQGNIANDEQRQCFPSSEAIEKIERELGQLPEHPFLIMFGHHPISFLCESGRARLISFARKHNSCIYLCGHNHIPKDEIVRPIMLRTHSEYSIHQIYVGGVFPDESGYNQCSFSIGTISQDRNQHDACVLYFRYYKDIFGEWVWEKKESGEFELRKPVNAFNLTVNRQRPLTEENPPIPGDNVNVQLLNVNAEQISLGKCEEKRIGEKPSEAEDKKPDGKADGKKPITAQEYFNNLNKKGE